MGADLVGGGSYGEPPLPLPDDSDDGPAPSEWRTPPLWGVADSAPYMHDGRAPTLADAVKLHGGQARGRELITSNSTRRISLGSSPSSRPCVRRDDQVRLWMRQTPPRSATKWPACASVVGAAGRSWASRPLSRPWPAANGR